jgi:8-oxo-dGTP pyrophosphatase MutT (NUDIX family)
MEIHNDVITSEPVDAATLLILRDSPDSEASGVEVFLIRRHVKSSVLGGVYVFPGGKVDPRDASPDWIKHLDVDAHTLKQRLNEPELSPDQALAIYVGAIRETFEECGVLFARSNTATENALRELDNSKGLLGVLDQHKLQLSAEDLVPFSRWITPKMASLMTKRFDTRFFLAKNPSLQVAKHDNFEATDSAWMSPREALTRYWNKEIDLAPPQIMSLANLSHFKSVDEALEAVRSRAPSFIRPEPFDEDGVRHLAYPGHPRHSEPEPAMGGPRLLRFLNQRFEPLGGFEAYFEDA